MTGREDPPWRGGAGTFGPMDRKGTGESGSARVALFAHLLLATFCSISAFIFADGRRERALRRCKAGTHQSFLLIHIIPTGYQFAVFARFLSDCLVSNLLAAPPNIQKP